MAGSTLAMNFYLSRTMRKRCLFSYSTFFQLLLGILLMIIESYGVIRYCEFNENNDDNNEIYFTCRHESSDCKVLSENRKKSSNCYIEECSGNTQSINCVSRNEPYDEKKSQARTKQL